MSKGKSDIHTMAHIHVYSDKKTFTINEKSKDLGLLKKVWKQERLRGKLGAIQCKA